MHSHFLCPNSLLFLSFALFLVVKREPRWPKNRQKERLHHEYYHSRSCVVCFYVVLKMFLCNCLDILSRSKNSPSQRRVLECCCMQMIKYHLLSLAFNLQHLKRQTYYKESIIVREAISIRILKANEAINKQMTTRHDKFRAS